MGGAPLRARARQTDGAAHLDLHGIHAGGVPIGAVPAEAGWPGTKRGEARGNVIGQSSSVEISPGFWPSSLAFNTRRMILPERVLGSEGTISISRGTAILPSSCLT